MTDILFVSDATIFGGAETAMFALAESVARRGLDVAVAVATATERYSPHLTRLRHAAVHVHVADAPLFAGPVGTLTRHFRRGATRRAAALLADFPASHIVVNLATLERGAAVVDAALRTSPASRVVAYVHLGQLPSLVGARRLARLRDRRVASLVSRFDAVLTVSDATARSVRTITGRPAQAVYPPSRAITQHFIDRRTARRQLGLNDELAIGLVGRVAFHQKGHDRSVRVARDLLALGVNATWVVVGDGPDLPRLRATVAEAGLDTSFRFLSWQEDLGALMPAFDVLAMPSNFEGLPLSAVEAAAAHIPVVAFAVDGIPELLPAPFAVPPGNEVRFTEVLREVLGGLITWPAAQMAARAAALCDPDAVADRFLAALAVPQPAR